GKQLEWSKAERLAGGVVDAPHLANRLRVLADADVHADAVRTTGHAGARVSDNHGRRLLGAVAKVATDLLPSPQGFDQPIGKWSNRALAPLERLGHEVDDARFDQGVALGCIVQALPHVHVV